MSYFSMCYSFSPNLKFQVTVTEGPRALYKGWEYSFLSSNLEIIEDFVQKSIEFVFA